MFIDIYCHHHTVFAVQDLDLNSVVWSEVSDEIQFSNFPFVITHYSAKSSHSSGSTDVKPEDSSGHNSDSKGITVNVEI